jgi:hypothetical protein
VILGAKWNGVNGSAVKVENGWFEVDGEVSGTTSKTYTIGMKTTFPNPIKILACAILGFKEAKEDVEGYTYIIPPFSKIHHWYDDPSPWLALVLQTSHA